MIKIGLIREGKTPPDTRVALTPTQCADVLQFYSGQIEIVAEPSVTRCFPDAEYIKAGVNMQDNLEDCDVIFGIKEVKIEHLIPNKIFFFFSHTKKKQPYNQPLMHALIEKKVRMIDYEALTYEDGARILGFGVFAGVVGAHNGLMTYGKKTRMFSLIPAHACKDMDEMLKQYRYVKLPPVKIAVTGSGRVTAGILEIMHHWDIESVEPEDFLVKEYDYPVYTLLKGAALYENKNTGAYSRDDFHHNPEQYQCKFLPFTKAADILMNGIYWDKSIPRLFEKSDVANPEFRIKIMADITCDEDGSVPINLGSSTIADPVYGIDRNTIEKVAPFQNDKDIIDVMAVDNLPNELPRDASEHFGEHIIKYILPELLKEKSDILDRATICKDGKLTTPFEYLSDYAYPVK
ncbi:alanine dehydrogenase [Taibaiella lutea]|uniref:Alanine dehydrogenase n=1 Tax=Taibaiella lutea TaxID=2608001 RepID=A0A5M6CJA9_9BACT|nr:NAD(P)-dependent oxidoreductase [Taibaiella lutea]KAA5535116.1 alanine dehydrogenase [Taibaiella lutea]